MQETLDADVITVDITGSDVVSTVAIVRRPIRGLVGGGENGAKGLSGGNGSSANM